MEIVTSILISSSPEKVWRVLTDFNKHPEWNPFIKSINGELSENKKLDLHISPPGRRGMKFHPRVIRVKKNAEFAWKGNVLFPGLFDGEHFFRLEQAGQDQTRLIHGEKFSGILVPLLKGLLKDTASGFELMNKALKERVENIN